MTRNHRHEALGLRRTAFAFMRGVSNGWHHQEFVDWYVRHLMASGYMRPPAYSTQIQIREPGIGIVELAGEPYRIPLRERLDTMSRFFLALVSAHTRVLTTLRCLVKRHSIDFVHAAHQGGRLRRSQEAEEWVVSLEPDDGLSDCVLALFAADYMNHSKEYLQGKVIRQIGKQIRFLEGGSVSYPYSAAQSLPRFEF